MNCMFLIKDLNQMMVYFMNGILISLDIVGIIQSHLNTK